jgi:hypothetical protein
MALRGHRWAVSAPQTKIEESTTMKQKRATQRRWIVHRRFEPDRLSPTTLIQAYAHIVPYHIRVLRLPPARSEAAEVSPEQKQTQQSDPVTPKITELTGVQSQSKRSLVIEPITKKEVS